MKIYGEIENADLENTTNAEEAAISAPSTGRLIYNSTIGRAKYYNGSAWLTVPFIGDNAHPTVNLAMKYLSGVLTFTGSDGTALGTQNPAFVRIKKYDTDSQDKDQYVILKMTTTPQLDDDSSGSNSDFLTGGTGAGSPMGTTTAVAWANARPFFLYAINTDNTDAGLYFGFCQDPTLAETPSATTDLSYNQAPAATPALSNFHFITDTNIKSSGFLSRPVTLIGGLAMTKAVTTDDWTVVGYRPVDKCGITDRPHVGRWYTMSVGQLGATATYAFLNPTGNPPSWASAISNVYQIRLDGTCKVIMTTRQAGNCTNGSTNGALSFVVPYLVKSIDGSTAFMERMIIGSVDVSTGPVNGMLVGRFDNGSALIDLITGAAATAGTNLLGNLFSNSADDIEMNFEFPAFLG